MKNTLLKIAGYLAVGLVSSGLVPMLPTTPFPAAGRLLLSESDPG